MTCVTLWGAGSLRGALNDLIDQFERACQVEVKAEFGPSGVLRQRIEAGERPDVFASADLGHPRALRKSGLAGPEVVFAHNEICALGRVHPDFNSPGLVDYLLKVETRLGTSTPGHDPGGDYAWAVFRRAETSRPGAFQALSAKARQLVGGPDNSTPLPGQSLVLDLFDRDLIDVFLGYRSTAYSIISRRPDLARVDLPAYLRLQTDCSLTILAGATFEAAWLAMFILGAEGQNILKQYGFQVIG